MVLKMNKIRKIVSLVIMVAMLFVIQGCKNTETGKNQGKEAETIVAKIGEKEITLADLNEEMDYMIATLKEQYGKDFDKNEEVKELLKQQREQFLDYLVETEVFLQKAEQMNITASDEEAQEKIQVIKGQFETEEEFAEALKENGLTIEKLQQQVLDEVKIGKVIDAIFEKIEITDDQVNAFYDENKEYYTQEPGAMMSHILVGTEEEAKNIKEKYTAGTAFETLAAEYGTDATKDNGGSLGYVSYEEENIDADFLEAAKQLKEGEVSEPIETQFGWHLIQVKDIQTESRIIPVSELIEEIKYMLTQEEQYEIYYASLDEWKEELNVETHKDRL